MEILTSVVGKVADYTVVPIGRQASYLIFYNGKFKMLEAHVNNLHALRERMFHLVEEERGNGKEIERDVLNWLEKVNEVIERANQLQKDPRRANARCSSWGFPNLILRYQQSRKATKIANNVIQVEGEGTFDRVGYLPALDRVASSSSIRGGEMYETRESIKEKIVKALSNPNSRNIGIYGLGGVGKTTLVEEVTQIAKQLKLFDKVVITHVSLNPDFKTIQGEIADLLGLRFDEETIFGRANRLRQRIKMEKSILVILDNIWSMLDLKKVGIPIGNEHNGCKLLMTCRNLDVLLQMDVPMDFTFKLERMSENETWKLFQFMAGDVVKDNNLKDVAIQVAQKCEGLPLRVVTVARAMRNKRDIQSWKDALRKLQCNDHTEMDSLTYSALELSYNLLESDEMRDLFLLFALMEGNNAEYFLKVAMGLNILKHVNTIDEARNKLYTIIRSLEVTCLLLDIKRGGMIQMHDFVHDFAIYIARRDKHVFLRKHPHEEWPTKDFLKRCTQIALSNYQNVELPQTIYCPNIKFFYLLSKNRALEIPNTFFEGLSRLSEIDICECNSVKEIVLGDNKLSANNDITNENIEFLQLRSLTLEHLETLDNFFFCQGLESSISSPFFNAQVVFPNLHTLKLSSLPNLNKIWDDSHHSMYNLTNLTVDDCGGLEYLFSSAVVASFKNLKLLKISSCPMMEEIIAEEERDNALEEVHFLKLEKIILLDMDNLKTIWHRQFETVKMLDVAFSTRCSHLKELHITECENIKEIVAEEKESSMNVAPIFEFNQLSTLLLRNLGKLEGLYAKKHTLVCPSLKRIDVFNCTKLNLYRALSTRSSNFLDDQLSVLAHQPLFIAEEVIPTLEMLRIDNKEANMLLQAQNSSGLFTKMTYLALCAYKNEDTFPYLFLQNAGSLESLSVEQSCFEKIFQDEGQINETTHTRLKNLYLIKLPKLQHICGEGSQIDPVLEVLQVLWVTNCSSLINLLPSSATLSHLEYMDITDCKGLKNLITSPTMQSLHKLRRLKVENCCSLEEVITGEENIHITLISLEELVLKWLPRLNQFCSKKCFLKFPLLEVVIVRDCPRMKVFSEGYTSTPNLQKVQIVEDDEEWFWKGNINDTITSMFEDKEVLLSNTLNETISSHLEDEELGSKNGVDTDLEE
ncbi:putative disease resistance protein [Trifolium repens]|nr:putative disease resistance protein [Trifolium repens]